MIYFTSSSRSECNARSIGLFVLHISEDNESAKIIFGRYRALCIFSPFCPNYRTIKFDVSRRDENPHIWNPPYEQD